MDVIDFTRVEIGIYYNVRLPHMPQPDRKEWRGKCPIHNGKDLNFSVDPSTGKWFCHSQCSRGGDVMGLEMELHSGDFVKAKAEVFRIVGRPLPSWQERDVEETYDYTDDKGSLLYQVVRKLGKKFMQRRPDGRGGWVWNLGKTVPVPYKLPTFAKAILIGCAEGERDVHSLVKAGWTATCNNGGAGNFKPELVPWFAGKHVAIFADNDEPGRKHAIGVATLLHPVAASVRIVELPGLPLKGDVTDYLATGKDGDDLHSLYEQADDWSPEWRYVTEVPHENDKYLRTFAQTVHEAGGVEAFWKTVDVDGLPTPFVSLTENLGGLRKGEYYVIGANQGMGKSSLALQFASVVLENRGGVLYFSMEMGHRDIFQRIAAIDARVDLMAYRKLRKYHDDAPLLLEMDRALRESTSKFSKAPLFVSTKRSVTTEFLLQESLRIKQRGRVDLVIVDHMQLMGTTGKAKSDYEKFTEISRSIHGISQEVNVPGLLVSQTSRANSKDKRMELDSSDLRGTGAIEEDAAAVLLLYYDREDFTAAKADPTGERLKKGPIRAWLKLDKNRYGPQGTYTALNHFKSLTRFDLLEART